MKLARHVTAVLLLAAIPAAGCSKRGEASGSNAEPMETADAKPVATGGEIPAVPPITIPQPPTFADGKAAYSARNYTEATAIFEGYTGRRPDNAWGHYMLGLSAWKSGDLAKAEAALEKALTIDPHHVKSLVNLGRVLIEQKRSEEALEKLTRAADIDPQSTEVQRLLGRTYLELNRIDEAEDTYRRAIELNELDAWSMNNLGLLLLESGRVDEAMPLFAKAVELRTDVAAFHNNLGMSLEHLGRYSEAAAAYSGALAADPAYEKAQTNLARVEAVKQ